jgi:hypothetical protein
VFTESAMNRVLEQLEVLLPYTYAQFLAEDAATRDYRVIAERIPGGGASYAVAHRTGVIGQVFRTQRAIVVPDTRHHPLYDPFDITVDWEIAIPLFRNDAFAGVLNVEGNDSMALQPDNWNRISRLVCTATDWSIPPDPPDAEANVLLQTERSFFARELELVERARQLAGEGKSVLMIASPSEFARPGHPTLDDVERGRVPLAECVRGVDARIDAITLNGNGLSAFESLGGWSLVEGRYDIVLARG